LESDHTAALLAVAASMVRSYRRLPLLFYEVWHAVEATDRPTGGLMGWREGRVVDAWSLQPDGTQLDASYGGLREALATVMGPWELGMVDAVAAEDGDDRATGHAQLFPIAGGETPYVHCPACCYAAVESASRVTRDAPPAEDLLPMQEVLTPDCKTIAGLAAYLSIPPSRTAKAVFLVAGKRGVPDRFIFAVVRGDTALSEARLRDVLGAEALAPASEEQIRRAGSEPGYGSPVGLAGVTVVADVRIMASTNLVAGANRAGFHLRNVNAGRDFSPTLVADIAQAQEGSPCPRCGAALAAGEGVALIEMRREASSPVAVLDSEGKTVTAALASCRVHVDRILGALAERHAGEKELAMPAGAAPYDVALIAVGKGSPELSLAAEAACAALTGAGLAVLYDDRDERAGVKFNDADLIGAPVRIVIGDRGLAAGTAELKRRGGEVEAVPLEGLAATVRRALGDAGGPPEP
jgi:prolyl-tRNA synthetase